MKKTIVAQSEKPRKLPLRLWVINIQPMSQGDWASGKSGPVVVLAESLQEASFKISQPWKVARGLRDVSEFK